MNVVKSRRVRLGSALTLALLPISGIPASYPHLASAAEPLGGLPPGSPGPPDGTTYALAAPLEKPVRIRNESDAVVRIASPKGNKALTRADLENLDVPLTAMMAYRFAARTMQKVDETCGLEWTLLAAIGSVESNHGRYAGSRLHSDGTVRPSIRGIPLNGNGPVAEISDTDAGELDGDRVWDRAVGPMQFLPSTWKVAGVDGNGDGIRSPDNMYDAALASSVYLCEQPGSLSTERGMRTAVYGYNHSESYVELVTGLARGFETGDFTVPGTMISGTTPLANPVGSGPGYTLPRPGRGAGSARGKRTETAPEADAKPLPSSDDVVVVATPPKPKPLPDPKPELPPLPDPEPTELEPEPEAAFAELSGALTACDTGWCIGEVALDFGDATQLAAQAIADLDADGTTETLADELAGLAGVSVVLGVATGTAPAVVYTINGVSYRLTDDSSATAP